ncbi:lysozyme inhibitor LprI family protein [Dyella sp. GSA-30]|uniref:lysozyme inhibitor LprI family protein n=1 Tax=Dyella sp. GSA-30 TaxID=2994496 RepID=UPI0024932D15|nr:lysozyme inhibitor LprI family protein [Dyella sp. GSA-30]BDU18996.1 hypothetical protein DYGSA30_04530 [Dyella sp. GSA-30]
MLFATALLLLASEGSILSRDSVVSVINDCWKGHGHAGMSACVEVRARVAQANLGQAEKAASEAIRASADERSFPEYPTEAMTALHRASSAFSKYVASECSYEAALAAKGNGSEDVRSACVAVLDEERAQLIRAALSVH